MVTPEFMRSLEVMTSSFSRKIGREEPFKLLYVGRLHREKLVDDLVEMMMVLQKNVTSLRPVKLYLVGDGPQKVHLCRLADSLKVASLIEFVGPVLNQDLPRYLVSSDVFVSPLTGQSLREAAIAGLPVVAYDMDWVSGFLKHEETALMVRPGDCQEMARQVLRLMTDDTLRASLSRNIKELGLNLWVPRGLRDCLDEAFAAGSV
jgi:glycosyltransferase involved in cell wall biosynthesis